ncbi:MAG: hypothetical protein EHM18_09565 [Acidobacteria bacterium]|nr:MAG: hypothetical protein EHM18_09565 [Acidobacteriota bacterium]
MGIVPAAPDVKERIRLRVPAVGRLLACAHSGFQSAGSAVVVDPGGLVVATVHQIQDRALGCQGQFYLSLPDVNNPHGQLTPERRYPLSLVRLSAVHDLALLKIDAESGYPFASLPLAPPEPPALLDTVYVLGYPELGGASITICQGVVAGVEDSEGWLKLDTHLVHGYSGGAVLNEKGELIGIPVQKRIDYTRLNVTKSNGPSLTPVGSMDFARGVSAINQLVSGRLTGSSHVRVTGTINAERGKPIANALVALLRGRPEIVDRSNVLGYGWTVSNGSFLLMSDASEGEYTLRVKAEGYQPKDHRVRIGKGEPTPCTIQLEPTR